MSSKITFRGKCFSRLLNCLYPEPICPSDRTTVLSSYSVCPEQQYRSSTLCTWLFVFCWAMKELKYFIMSQMIKWLILNDDFYELTRNILLYSSTCKIMHFYFQSSQTRWCKNIKVYRVHKKDQPWTILTSPWIWTSKRFKTSTVSICIHWGTLNTSPFFYFPCVLLGFKMDVGSKLAYDRSLNRNATKAANVGCQNEF